MPSLEKHIAALKSMSLFDDTDFKLAPCELPSDARATRECGFTELSIRVVKVSSSLLCNGKKRTPFWEILLRLAIEIP